MPINLKVNPSVAVLLKMGNMRSSAIRTYLK